MKLMRLVSISIATLFFSACTAPESANPAPRCAAASDCAPGLQCYRGFCVLDPADLDELGDGAKADDGTDAALPATMEDAATSIVPDGDAGAAHEPTTKIPSRPALDAGATSDAARANDAAIAAKPDAIAPTADAGSGADPADPCNRDALRTRADAYLAAMATGNASTLSVHPSLRYTENGQQQRLGLGVWLTRPQPVFARHVIDEVSCSTVSEAVLQEVGRRIIVGVRLRYLTGQLLEAEAQVVIPNGAYYDPDGLIPSGTDPWTEPVPSALRMSRDALLQLAANYFDAISDTALLPPHAPSCRRRQNGALMPQQGSCGIRPGNRPFEERRFPVVDETTGIVTAIVIYDRFVGMYLFKAYDGQIQDIGVVGGASARSSGW